MGQVSGFVHLCHDTPHPPQTVAVVILPYGYQESRNVIPVNSFGYSCQINEWCEQLATCGPSERNGVAGWEKMKISSCATAQTSEYQLLFRRWKSA